MDILSFIPDDGRFQGTVKVFVHIILPQVQQNKSPPVRAGGGAAAFRGGREYIVVVVDSRRAHSMDERDGWVVATALKRIWEHLVITKDSYKHVHLDRKSGDVCLKSCK